MLSYQLQEYDAPVRVWLPQMPHMILIFTLKTVNLFLTKTTKKY